MNNKKDPDQSISSLEEINEELKQAELNPSVPTYVPPNQIPAPYPQPGQIPVTFAPADKLPQTNLQAQNISAQIPLQGSIPPPQPAYNAVMPMPPNPQLPIQQPGMQPQAGYMPQNFQQPFPEMQPGMPSSNQMHQPQQPMMQPYQIPPQSFAVPGQNPENSEAPQPFNPAPPAYLPVMAPAVNHYPWQQGAHYVIGQPANYQYLYYPGAAPAKALIGQQALNIPQGQQFQQQKIDMRQNNQGEGKVVANAGCHCQGPWGFLLASGIIVIVGLVLGVIIHPGIFAVFAFAYLVRSIVICCSDTAKFLQLLNLDINPYEHTEQLQKTEPYTVWRIQCYHFETRTRTVTSTDSNGNTSTRTQTYTVRVNTHSNSKHITYPNCGDASPILSGVEDYRMTRIYYSFVIAFDSAEVQKEFNEDRRDWIRKNDRDTHYQFSSDDVLPGLITHFLSFNDKKQNFPKCLNCLCFSILAIFLLDWILIFWFMRHSARLDYRFLKVASNYDKH